MVCLSFVLIEDMANSRRPIPMCSCSTPVIQRLRHKRISKTLPAHADLARGGNMSKRRRQIVLALAWPVLQTMPAFQSNAFAMLSTSTTSCPDAHGDSLEFLLPLRQCGRTSFLPNKLTAYPCAGTPLKTTEWRAAQLHP